MNINPNKRTFSRSLRHDMRRWTESSKECYQRGCICKECTLVEYCKKYRFTMKKSVIELVKAIGKPFDRLNNILRD